jgi:hypothetical protein
MMAYGQFAHGINTFVDRFMMETIGFSEEQYIELLCLGAKRCAKKCACQYKG